jgi:hypothetical protein
MSQQPGLEQEAREATAVRAGTLFDDVKPEMKIYREEIFGPGYLEWAGVAVLKKAYQIFREHRFRLRLLPAAFRNHLHWSEFIGGDLVISPPYSWQVRFNPQIDELVEPKVVADLLQKFVDFRHAHTGAMKLLRVRRVAPNESNSSIDSPPPESGCMNGWNQVVEHSAAPRQAADQIQKLAATSTCACRNV